MADPGPTELPIFELPLVLLPGEQVPLHIFEPRYKRMVERSLQQEEPFGIVFRDDDGARARGCAAAVVEVVERFEDGRLNIVVAGEWRFDVVERFEAAEYPAALVAAAPDAAADPGPGPDPGPAHAAFAELLAAVGAEDDDDPAAQRAADAGDSSFAIASRVELPVAFKQQLLEEDAEPRRLELLSARLLKLARQVKRARELAERARSNGHGPVEGLRGRE